MEAQEGTSSQFNDDDFLRPYNKITPEWPQSKGKGKGKGKGKSSSAALKLSLDGPTLLHPPYSQDHPGTQDISDPSIIMSVSTPEKRKLADSTECSYTPAASAPRSPGESIRPVLNTERSKYEGLSDESLLAFYGPNHPRTQHISMNNLCTPEKRKPIPPTTDILKDYRLRIELIAAKGQIYSLESRLRQKEVIIVEQQIAICKAERGYIMEQHKRDEAALINMDYLHESRKLREQHPTEDYNQIKNELEKNKTIWDMEKMELHKQITELKDKLLQCEVTSQAQLSEIQRDLMEFQQGLEASQAEVETLKTELAKQTSIAQQCPALKSQLEQQSFELLTVTNKLRELEHQMECAKNMELLTKLQSSCDHLTAPSTRTWTSFGTRVLVKTNQTSPNSSFASFLCRVPMATFSVYHQTSSIIILS